MPVSYKVKSVGFFNGHMYDPNGKRPVLTVDEPLKKENFPSWLEPEPIKSVKKTAKKKTAKKEKSTQEQVAEASSVGDGAEASFLDSNKVETL